ncbi:HlyD family secretion protein [Thalassotalea fusca]
MIEIPEKKVFFDNKTKLAIALLMLLSIFLFIALSDFKQSVSKEYVEKVELSELKIELDTYGKLRTKNRVGLIAESKGNVAQIFLKPGASVREGEAILKLVNPKTLRALKSEQLNLQVEHQEIAKLKVDWEQKLKEQEAEVLLAEAQFNLSTVDLQANKKLKQNNVISALELEKSKVKNARDKKVHEIEKSRLESIQKISTATIEAAKLKLKQIESNVELLQSDVDKLVIKAPMDGILMSLDDKLEVGKQIDDGTFLGLVIDKESLYAELLVSSSKAHLLKLGQDVLLSIKGSDVVAGITRISPIVVNGSIEIDAEIKTELPSIAIPNIDVTGKIAVLALNNTLVAKRPAFVDEPNASYHIHVSDGQSNDFVLKEIYIGQITKEHMQILTPLQPDTLFLFELPAHLQTTHSIHVGELDG